MISATAVNSVTMKFHSNHKNQGLAGYLSLQATLSKESSNFSTKKLIFFYQWYFNTMQIKPYLMYYIQKGYRLSDMHISIVKIL